MDDKEVMLVGFDIYQFVKTICEKTCDKLSEDMTENEKKAYKLGNENALRILEAALSDGINAGSECYHNIAVHVPDLKIMTEFATIDEILSGNYDTEEVGIEFADNR